MINIKEAISKIKSIDNLKTVIEYYNVKLISEPGGYKALCPLHNEKTPSFHIKTDNKGEAIWSCFGGCNNKKNKDIVNFIEEIENISNIEALKKAYEILGLSLSMQPSKLDNFISFIKEKNNEIKSNGKTFKYESTYTYHNSDNKPVYLKNKYRNTADKSKKTFITKAVIETDKSYKYGDSKYFNSTEKVLYNLPRVKNAMLKDQYIYFVEGEKDADNLNRLGFAATTIYSKKWDNNYSKQLQGSKIVFIGDTGKAGEEFKNLVWNNLKNIVKSFKVVELPGIEALGDNADVTDWLESGKTKDDLRKAIKDSQDYCISTKWKDITIVEKKDGKKEVKPLKTLDNFKLILKRAKTNILLNEISKVFQIDTKFFNNKTLDTLITEIQSHCVKEGFKCTNTDVRNWLEAVGREKSENPFKTWLDKLPKWDNESRIDSYIANFVTTEDYNSELKTMLMKKWLLSFCGSVYDDNYKAYGFLVLKGGQGIGKGECFKRLIPIKEDWVFLGEQEFKGDRDNIQILTSHLLVELSEFARSVKKVNELKGFVTQDKDSLSLKYDKYTTTNKRNTIYFATVNDAEFLIDDENRRMWIIELESINWEGINNFDYIQLWSEIKETYLTTPVIEGQPCYHLTPYERDLLQISNKNYEFRTELETTLEALLNFEDPRRLWLKSSEIARILDIKASGTAITKALKRLGETTGSRQRIDGGPLARYNSCPIPRCWYGELNATYKKRLVNIQIVNTEEVEKVQSSTELKNQLKKANEIIKLLQQQLHEKDILINELQSDIMKLEQDNKTWELYFKEMEEKNA